MKVFTSIILLLFFVQLTCYAQTTYSLENLEKASQEEREILLNKALKLQRSGKTVTIVGGSILGTTAVSIAAIAIADPGDWALGALVVGFFGGIAGLGTMAAGIPMKATGKKRVERINSINNSTVNAIHIDLRPCVQYNLAAQNYQPGVGLVIRF